MSPARILLSCGVVALAAGIWFGKRLPEVAQLAHGVLSDPVQLDRPSPVFASRAGGVDYRIAPVADYDIAGVVVSRHDSDAWYDWIHDAFNDHLNVVDLCLVWGANAADGAYRKMRFSSGQFVCYVETNDPDALQPAYLRALSNNHLLTSDPALARRLRALRVGDQVRLRGQLAAYSHTVGGGFQRGTSTVREDTGNGACETVYVHELTLLRAAPHWPRGLRWAGAALLALGLLMWWRAPPRARS